MITDFKTLLETEVKVFFGNAYKMVPESPYNENAKVVWGKKTIYDQEIADALISTARTSIATSSSKDLNYLKTYSDWLADFVAQYTKFSPVNGESFMRAHDEIKKILFEDSLYIQGIRMHQEELSNQNEQEENEFLQDTRNETEKFIENTRTMRNGCIVRATPKGDMYATRRNGRKVIIDTYKNDRAHNYLVKQAKYSR